MQIVKQSVARALPCLLIQSADGQTPETGALAGSVTISYRKEGATAWSSKTATGNWTEITPGKGAYLISWSTADFNTVGRFDFVVEHASCINFYGSYDVSANLLDDIVAAIAALNDLAQSDILSDATPFDGAKVDAAITSRSSHAAAAVVALMNDLDAAAVLAAITTDSTKWAGANIANLDAAITTRSSHAAADVVALMNDLNAAEILAAITTDSTKFAGGLIANLDAAITTRSSHAAADVVALLNNLSAADVLAAITTDSTKFAGSLIANLDAAITSRSSHTAAAVVALMNDLDASEILAAITTDDTKFAGADIATIVAAIAALNDPTVAAIVTGVWSELQAGYTTPGTFGFFLDAAISSVGGGAAPSAAEIAEAVHDIKLAFNKTTGALEISMADDTLLTSVTITDTATEVTRE